MRRVPDPIRQEVLTQWLLGIVRDTIAKNVDIGEGTVSEIVRKYGEHPDFNTLRSYVVCIKNQGSDVKRFASAIRLDRRLEKLGLDRQQVEDF